jgi:hypothetical protein
MWTVAGGRRMDGPGLHLAVLAPGAVARGVIGQRGPFRQIVLRLRVEALVGAESSFAELRWNPEPITGPRIERVRFPVVPTETVVEVACELPPGRFGAADELRNLWLMPMECLGVCTIESVRLDRYR